MARYRDNEERVIPIEIVSTKKANNHDANGNDIQLPVTLADGTPTEAAATVTHLRNVRNNNNEDNLEIKEIGVNTLERERGHEIWNPNTVRVVPIKLHDGKVIQKDPEEETVKMRAEFTNFSHQEFPGNCAPKTEEIIIPRFDTAAKTKESRPGKERVIPIRLEGTGETITPSFRKLEDPQPPDWSAFTQKKVPIRLARPRRLGRV